MPTVPDKYDVVINGQGYMCADLEEVKATYGYTPPFVPRANTQGDFGDNFQDFWLTFTQRDWSLGEDQRFMRVNDADRVRRCWRTDGVDLSNIGEARIQGGYNSLTFAERVFGAARTGSKYNTFSPTKLYEVDEVGTTITDKGAHGVTLSDPTYFAYAQDGSLLFIGGTTVRTWNGTAFAAFSASSGLGGMAFINNALYSFEGSLYSYSTAGVRSAALHQFKGGTGSILSEVTQLLAFGGKLAILRSSFAPNYGPELWLYDGVGVQKVGEWSGQFTASGMCVAGGAIIIVGRTLKKAFGSKIQLWAYVNGALNLVWESVDYPASMLGTPGIATFQNGVAFTDNALNLLRYYDAINGGVFTLAPWTANVHTQTIASQANGLLVTQNATTGLQFSATTIRSSGSLTSSLIDFETSLNKIFRGIKLDFDVASDGDGGSIDIAYRLNDLEGSYTSLQTGAVSGTEYPLSGIVGRSISIRVTLNKGTSTNGPRLKRVSLRAVPQQGTYRKGTLVLYCVGRDGKSPVIRRDGTPEPKDGLTLAQALQTAATSGTPIAITDQFGTLSAAVIEAEGFALRQVRSNEFIAVVPYREV